VVIRFRTAQLACLLLLLTSIGAAERPMRGADSALSNRYISVLLLHRTSVARAETPLTHSLDQATPAAPSAAPFLNRSVWTMRPPSAHSVRVHAVTGSSL
jgi:hypothetical protein